MAAATEFSCRCGAVSARIAAPSPGAVNRATCYCDDCQAFAHRLGRADLLDAHGGSDIVQVAPAWLTFLSGQENIAGLRLSPKGLHRFYARCCNTPLGNALGPALPFVGLAARAMGREAGELDRLFGESRGAIMGQFAVGETPPNSRGVRPSQVAGLIARLLRWKLSGAAWPNPLFDRATRQPLYPVSVLSREERDALRRFCGPKPTAN